MSDVNHSELFHRYDSGGGGDRDRRSMDFYYGHDSNDKAATNFGALLNYGNLHQAREDAAYFGNEDNPAAIHVARYTQRLWHRDAERVLVEICDRYITALSDMLWTLKRQDDDKDEDSGVYNWIMTTLQRIRSFHQRTRTYGLQPHSRGDLHVHNKKCKFSNKQYNYLCNMGNCTLRYNTNTKPYDLATARHQVALGFREYCKRMPESVPPLQEPPLQEQELVALALEDERAVLAMYNTDAHKIHTAKGRTHRFVAAGDVTTTCAKATKLCYYEPPHLPKNMHSPNWKP